MKRMGHVRPAGKNRNTYRLLIGKTERKRPPSRDRGRKGDNLS
jgi:hypothetical protein